MKKRIVFFCCLSLLSGCGSPSSQAREELLFLLNDLFVQKKIEIRLDGELLFTTDGASFIDHRDGKTYFKYLFRDNYQIYDAEGILEENGENESFDASFYYSILDPLFLNEHYFSVENGIYSLKSSYFSRYNLPTFESSHMLSLQLLREENTAHYRYRYEEKNIELTFTSVGGSIRYYGTEAEDASEFYLRNRISAVRDLESKIDSSSFIVILTSLSCAACSYSEPLYYEFSLEYDYKDFCSFRISDFTSDERTAFLNRFSDAYKTQPAEFRYGDYEEYPPYFLTPTAIRFEDGKAKYVKPGFGESEGEIFLRFCFA